MRRLNRWRRTARWRGGGKVDNVGGGLGVAISSNSIWGKGEITAGIGTLGYIMIGLVG